MSTLDPLSLDVQVSELRVATARDQAPAAKRQTLRRSP